MAVGPTPQGGVIAHVGCSGFALSGIFSEIRFKEPADGLHEIVQTGESLQHLHRAPLALANHGVEGFVVGWNGNHDRPSLQGIEYEGSILHPPAGHRHKGRNQTLEARS